MISPQPQFNLQNAKVYFREHLAVGDFCAVRTSEYLAETRMVPGEWFGRGAGRLNLAGPVGEKEFVALCEGNDPATGNRLTQRRNNVRRKAGKWVANRRIFYDYTISPPKSISLVALLQDPRIVGAHERAVAAALAELETFAETRVRRGQKREGRLTGNLVVARFRHDTSRELDPHLHTHCIVFNATFDPAENRWKAVETHGMLKARRFANSVYEHELCRELRGLGYEFRSKGNSFEIAGVPQSVIERFSKRHRQIDDETARRIARGKSRGNLQDVREQVAHDKRRRKIRESTAERLRQSWSEQLGVDERAGLESLAAGGLAAGTVPSDLPALLDWGERHVFERSCVVPQHELLAAALLHGRGQNFSLAGLREELARRPTVFALDGGEVTSRELVGLEMDLVAIARQTGQSEGPIHAGFTANAQLGEEQRRAVMRILESRSFITLFRGGAGTGKSFTLREVKRGIEEANRPVLVLAPQRQQVIGLEDDGLPAQTLAQFLVNPVLPERAVVILDEAGQVGIRDLHRLTETARNRGARLILSGDSRQHGAVAASDALILLERHGGLPVAKLRAIRRQDPRLVAKVEDRRAVAAYRAAVRHAAKGLAGEALDRLEALGWVQEHAPGENRGLLAKAYVEALGRNERALVVAQTWNEVDAVNAAVRKELRLVGRLGVGTPLGIFRAVDLTAAQKEAAENYAPGTKVFFLRRYGRYLRGDVCPVVAAGPRGITLLKDGRRSTVAYRYADRLAVLSERVVEIAPGERLQLRWNGRSADGQPIVNGELVTVSRIDPDGHLHVEDDRGRRKVLGPEQRLCNHGYAVTAYASQGKTVDTVLFSDAGSELATNRKQWLVTISRARRRALIFTPDRKALRLAINADGHRKLAIDGARDGHSLARFPTVSAARRERMSAAQGWGPRTGPGARL
jgi:conjugative relaxase-like TrwC/TraI family protein